MALKIVPILGMAALPGASAAYPRPLAGSLADAPFDDPARTARDPQMRKAAARALPPLRRHLEMAENAPK